MSRYMTMKLTYTPDNLAERQEKSFSDRVIQLADEWVTLRLLPQERRGNLIGIVVLNHCPTEIERAVIDWFNSDDRWRVTTRRRGFLGFLWHQHTISFYSVASVSMAA